MARCAVTILTVLLASFNDLVVSEQYNATFNVYAGYTVQMINMETSARSSIECSTKCSVVKYGSNSCQSATFRRDTRECFLSNGTIADIQNLHDNNFKTMIVLPSGPYNDNGTEFYTGFMRNYNPTALDLFFVSDVPTTVTLEIPALSISESFELNDTLIRVYNYSLAHMFDGEQGLKGVYVSATEPISLYQYVNNSGGKDISFVPPTSQIGRNYIIQPSPNDAFVDNMFLITSTKDGTMVTISNSSETTTLLLNRMETYFRYTSNLFGMVVTATEDIVVQAGSPCAVIPSTNLYCDYAYEILPPEESYGQSFIVSYMHPRPDYTIGILGKVNQTTVTIADMNGVTLETLLIDRAESAYRDYFGSQTITVSSSEGVLITQYGHGDGMANTYPYGDPSMMVIGPLSKLGTVYDILLPSEVMNVIEVITDDETLIRFNGSPAAFVHSLGVTAAAVGSWRIAYAVEIGGRYRITHINDVPFAVYVYGGGFNTEYAMCAGWLR